MQHAELIVALDTQDVQEAYAMAESFCGVVSWVKVGLELFVQGGPQCIATFKKMGFKVFLDLKMYDIPNTVYGGVYSACAMGVDLLTIHLQGGERMAKAAMKAVHDFTASQNALREDGAQNLPQGQPYCGPLVFGVTVLTSMSQGELPLNAAPVDDLVLQLAKNAHTWGLDGVVSSGHEVHTIHKACGQEFLCLTPGIRPKTQDGVQDDQRRTLTPKEAVQAGARFLVVGRPITKVENPKKAAQEILQEMQLL